MQLSHWTQFSMRTASESFLLCVGRFPLDLRISEWPFGLKAGLLSISLFCIFLDLETFGTTVLLCWSFFDLSVSKWNTLPATGYKKEAKQFQSKRFRLHLVFDAIGVSDFLWPREEVLVGRFSAEGDRMPLSSSVLSPSRIAPTFAEAGVEPLRLGFSISIVSCDFFVDEGTIPCWMRCFLTVGWSL